MYSQILPAQDHTEPHSCSKTHQERLIWLPGLARDMILHIDKHAGAAMGVGQVWLLITDESYESWHPEAIPQILAAGFVHYLQGRGDT